MAIEIRVAILSSKTVLPAIITVTTLEDEQPTIELDVPSKLNTQGARILIGLLETAIKTIEHK
jgi:hypothetical protein